MHKQIELAVQVLSERLFRKTLCPLDEKRALMIYLRITSPMYGPDRAHSSNSLLSPKMSIAPLSNIPTLLLYSCGWSIKMDEKTQSACKMASSKWSENRIWQIFHIITEDHLPPQVMCIIQTNQI